MEYARLGSTGMKVSRICLGCMGFGDAEHWVHKWVLNEENSRAISTLNLIILQTHLKPGGTAFLYYPNPINLVVII